MEIDLTNAMKRIGALVKIKAIRLCPIDMGPLRRSIGFRFEGMEIVFFATEEYAEDMEYGKPPGILNEGEKADLTDWARRHNVSPRGVINKIEKKGIKVGSVESPMKLPNGTFRPFMRPAIYQSMKQIQAIIKEEVEMQINGNT